MEPLVSDDDFESAASPTDEGQPQPKRKRYTRHSDLVEKGKRYVEESDDPNDFVAIITGMKKVT